MKNLVRDFIKKESSSGIILVFVTIVALIVKNSPLSDLYTNTLHILVEFHFGDLLDIKKPFILWINDGLMTIFFLLIGLEIKREVLIGHLSTLPRLALPGLAALGGMIFPALIYTFFNFDNEFAMRGWAIPIATDIAFALGVLSVIGNRIPISLKIFLMALAIIDDIGAILIIAIFYTSKLSVIPMIIAVIFFIILLVLNKLKVVKITAYMLIGILLWVAILKSGIHATLAGILIALTIPLSIKQEEHKQISPLKILQKNLHFWVAYFILPLFAFVNAGVDLKGVSFEYLAHPVSLGVVCGLFLGKQLGIMSFTFLAIKFKLAKLPKCTTWEQIYGVSVLTGIGFTMSFFVNTLAFNDSNVFGYIDRIAILIGSILSGVIGYIILKKAKRRKHCHL